MVYLGKKVAVWIILVIGILGIALLLMLAQWRQNKAAKSLHPEVSEGTVKVGTPVEVFERKTSGSAGSAFQE
jgi:hypothetical protein